MKESLVAINLITKDRQLLNPTDVPILLYWNDGAGRTIAEEYFFNDVSHNYTIKLCCNMDLYTFSELNLFYFKDNDGDGEEDYTEYKVDIQELFELNKLNDVERVFYKEYINQIFDYLYNCVYKESPEWSLEPWQWEDDIIHIYKKIKEKSPDRVTKATVVNYVRSELSQKYGLNPNNTNWIIENLQKILKLEE